PINMSATGGKIALANTTTPLGCNGGSTPCTATQLASVVDLVGWDGANFFEGTSAAPATSNSTAIFRAGSGCIDTDDNGNDFAPAAATPAPRNTASPTHDCSVQAQTPPTGVGSASPASLPGGGTTLLTVAVTPGTAPASSGIAVSCDHTAIGGSATQTLFD